MKGHLKICWPFKEILSFDTLHVRMCIQYQVQICWESLFFVTIECELFKFMSVEFFSLFSQEAKCSSKLWPYLFRYMKPKVISICSVDQS